MKAENLDGADASFADWYMEFTYNRAFEEDYGDVDDFDVNDNALTRTPPKYYNK